MHVKTLVPAGPLQFTVTRVPLLEYVQLAKSPVYVKFTLLPDLSSRTMLPTSSEHVPLAPEAQARTAWKEAARNESCMEPHKSLFLHTASPCSHTRGSTSVALFPLHS